MPNLFDNFMASMKRKPIVLQPIRNNYGKRPDGSDKGDGWLGPIDLGDGNVATEYTTQSDAVKLNGKRIDFPTLVPTLTPDEVNVMKKTIIDQGDIPESIMQKAIDHAKKQLESGKSVFMQPPTMGDKVNEAIRMIPSYRK